MTILQSSIHYLYSLFFNRSLFFFMHRIGNHLKRISVIRNMSSDLIHQDTKYFMSRDTIWLNNFLKHHGHILSTTSRSPKRSLNDEKVDDEMENMQDVFVIATPCCTIHISYSKYENDKEYRIEYRKYRKFHVCIGSFTGACQWPPLKYIYKKDQVRKMSVD